MTTIDGRLVASFLRQRQEDGQKWDYGHALVIAGCEGMAGAAILACGAALRSGCGLVSIHIPRSERLAIHLAHPSAIVDCDPQSSFSSLPSGIERYTSIGVGCGLGREEASRHALAALLERLNGIPQERRPTLVLDADALNIISADPALLHSVPKASVLTPHLRELGRIAKAAADSGFIDTDATEAATDMSAWGYPWGHDSKKLATVRALSASLDSVVIAKGHRTLICARDGRTFINGSGNPGMAKGGSGDALTGLITGLAARGYTAEEAAIAGVWFHGLAGDRAAKVRGMESCNASDIVDAIRVDDIFPDDIFPDAGLL